MHLFNHVYLALRYQISGLQLILLGQLAFVASGFPHCTRSLLESKPLKNYKEVFKNEEDAGSFLGRRLLYNQFDFEVFTPGNLERECYEELCNYEEAREIFEDHDTTMDFWKGYSSKDSSTSKVTKIDVVGLLTGLMSAGTCLVVIGLLIYYLYIFYCDRRRHGNVPEGDCECRRSSGISRSPEVLPLNPTCPPLEPHDPPPYDLVACDTSPPPPYPGMVLDAKALKKSLSIPASQKFPVL
ncbi:transmembrane gamma-carboxyglutamic acid protein 4 [Spea bombifrons]|uniref:transmembrane gamma-carboxyglutamic acid protein 4 n=1 Tax=Spea bombifrons TaxID=233779 RepID=UPI00234BB4DC|nr:transmembrane gamma-carboxyglutamic acid protein 4 [Spea bombifrons]